MPILTDAIVRGLPIPPSGSKIVYDGGDPKKSVTGFGIRITAGGARAFVLNFRINGRERRLTIGSYPVWSVAGAREEAKRLRREIDRGNDPLGERIAAREAPTVSDLIERYLTEHAMVHKRARSRVEDERLIAQWIRPELGNHKIVEIRRVDIEKLHRKITVHGTPTRANRTLTLLTTMFTLAMGWELRADNPARGIKHNHEEPRSRYLSGDELRRLTEALSALPDRQAANAIKLLLLTGARRGEVLGASWDQFDLETGVWTKPSSHTKQKREHRIPLSAPARLLLASMRAAAQHPTYLFPERGGDRPISNVAQAWEAICKLAGLSGLRLHDLRHSYASILASAGLSLPVIGALLGHTQPGTTARYSHLFDDPLRAATERVGAVVTGNGGDTPAADVISLKRR